MRPRMQGLHHVAVYVGDLERSLSFYRDVMGMELEWQPDPDNAYLTSGSDNLALHRCDSPQLEATDRRLDHIGFVVPTADDVDEWARYLQASGIRLSATPRTHRDGARSLYFEDPDGLRVQIIHHPPISRG